MSEIVFIGLEAYGYYGGAHACEGAFMPKTVYDKFESTLNYVFNSVYFHELDGKHSEVEGDKMYKVFSGVKDAATFAKEKEVNFDDYVLEERLCDFEDGDEFTGVDIKEIEDATAVLASEIKEYVDSVQEVIFYLSPEDTDKVKDYVNALTK